jgi:hypothetical protein
MLCSAIFKLHVLGQLVALTLEFEQFLPLEAGLLSALEGNSIFWEMWEAWNLSAADVIATESGGRKKRNLPIYEP